MAAPDEVDQMQSCLSVIGTAKVISIAAGGSTRQESVRLGLKILAQAIAPSDDCPVLVHDGARCFVSQAVVDRVITGIVKFTACGAAVPVKDTIKEAIAHPATLPGQMATDPVDGLVGHQVIRTLDRSRLWAMQTPQGATFSLLSSAYDLADRQDWHATDDLALLELAGHTVCLVEGDYKNIKITTPDDLLYGEWLAQTGD
jgi:2-C-methyl-D-erythritol 4-phosphate cytidylyltransferase